MKRKEPIAVTQAIQMLAKLGETYGIEALHHVYKEAVSEHYACSARNEWRAKVAEAQGEMFAALGHE